VSGVEATRPLVIPELIQGTWTNLIVLTYSAHLDFFETHLLRQLSQVPNRIILADDRRLADQFAAAAQSGQRLRQANRTYLAAPIRNPYAAHAKAVLLTTTTAGRLLVGSGNLGHDGYAEPGELWNMYTYNDTTPQHRDTFAAVRSLIDGLTARNWLDPAAVAGLDMAWSTTPWLPAHPAGLQPVCHNLETPLIDAIAAAVVGPVKLVAVHAPFYDEESAALVELLNRLRPRRLRVLLTSDTSVDGGHLAHVLRRSGLEVSLQKATVTDSPSAFLHAKIIHVVGAKKEVLVTGSANLSRRALLMPAATGNIELAVIETRGPGGFADLYAPLTLQPLRAVTSLQLTYRGADETPAQVGMALLYSELRGRVLTLVFTETVGSGLPALAYPDGAPITPLATDSDNEKILFRLDAADIERIGGGGRIDVRLPGRTDEDEPTATWPYHVDALRNRLERASDNHLLGATGALPESDDDLFQLLKQLEQTLIYDLETAWKVAGRGPTASPPNGVDDVDTVRWEDIDWDRLYRHPRYRAYRRRRGPGDGNTSDIETILGSISARLSGFTGTDPENHEARMLDVDQDDLGIESGQAADMDEPDEAPSRPLSVSTRTRMAFNRLALRFAGALQHTAFQEKLGAVLTVRNAVIINHLMRELLLREAIDPGHAIAAQLATWSLLWGGPSAAGLVASLSEDERAGAEQVLTDTCARQTSLLALSELADYDLDDELRRAVREQTQTMSLSLSLGLDRHLLSRAASGPRQSAALIGNLRFLASNYTKYEIVEVMTAAWGIPTASASWERMKIRRLPSHGRPARVDEVDVLRVHQPIAGLTTDRAEADLARLAAHLTISAVEVDYVRIRYAQGRDVAYWDTVAGVGISFINDIEKDLIELRPEFPPWWHRLDELDGRHTTTSAA